MTDGRKEKNMKRKAEIIRKIYKNFGTDGFRLKELHPYLSMSEQTLRKKLNHLCMEGLLNWETEEFEFADILGCKNIGVRYVYSLVDLETIKKYIYNHYKNEAQDIAYRSAAFISFLEAEMVDGYYRCNFIHLHTPSRVLNSVLRYMERNNLNTLTLDGAKELFNRGRLSIKQLYSIARKVNQLSDGTLRLTPDRYNKCSKEIQIAIDNAKKEFDYKKEALFIYEYIIKA